MKYCFLSLSLILLSTSTLLSQFDPKLGFTWTQDHIFASQSEGSEITNIHLYGWGMLWPFMEGQSGEYDDGTILDYRITTALNDGQEVMLTLATAPSNYRQSGTPWNMDEKVMPSMEDQYISRVISILQDYPQIKYVQVWNELKGYWSTALNRWDHEAYTTFYNKVYNAIKAENSTILVGGGYVVLADRNHGWDQTYGGIEIDSRDMDAVTYWLQNAVGFDALCIDSKRVADDFASLTSYLKSLPGMTGKALWWSEFYNDSSESDTMEDCAASLLTSLDGGDIALWWLENSYAPFTDPRQNVLSIGEDHSLSAPEEELIAQPVLYPSPARDFFTIERNVNHPSEMTIVNTTGQILHRQIIVEDKTDIDISSLQWGVYFIKLDNSYHKLVVAK